MRRALFTTPVWAAGHYTGVFRQVILAFKDHGYTGLRSLLASLLAPVLERALAASDSPVWLVPVPSSLRGKIRRGMQPTLELARELQRMNSRLTVAHILRHRITATLRTVQPRKSLSRQARLGVAPGFTVVVPCAGAHVVLLDDVLTTGVTLESAAQALIDHGAVVEAAVVLASTPRRESSPPVSQQTPSDSGPVPGLR